MIADLAQIISKQARRKRNKVFRSLFDLNEQTRILDLGSESGDNIFDALSGTNVNPANVFIADLDPESIEAGRHKYGFTPILINESESLPFESGYFDIVFCSSVIEHVTIEKNAVWLERSGKDFRRRSLERQRQFAMEISRLGKRYFVQTPYRYFVIESHTWLPFLSVVPRWMLIPLLRLLNRFWFKSTRPDWNLLTRSELQSMFPSAEILSERWLGLTKSIMAVGLRMRNPHTGHSVADFHAIGNSRV